MSVVIEERDPVAGLAWTVLRGERTDVMRALGRTHAEAIHAQRVAEDGSWSANVRRARGVAAARFAATFVDATRQRSAHEPALQRTAELVTRLRLSDVVLFTEARYTRHLTQADLHSAFQDHPVALEHFPSGSLLPPPRILLDRHEALDRKATSSD